MPDFAAAVFAIGFTFLLAGFVKGVVGMGLPTVAMGLLVLLMPPAKAAALLIVPSLATNVWQLVAGPSLVGLLKRFWPMMVAICLGTFASIGLLTGGARDGVTAALGAVLAIYALAGLGSVRFASPRRAECWLAPTVGLVTGALTGATGVFVLPAVPYFSSLRLEKEELVQTLGLSFTVSTLSLAAALIASGEFKTAVATASVWALLPALGGMFLGQCVRNRLNADVFRRWFFIGLLILGAYMVMHALARTG